MVNENCHHHTHLKHIALREEHKYQDCSKEFRLRPCVMLATTIFVLLKRGILSLRAFYLMSQYFSRLVERQII